MELPPDLRMKISLSLAARLFRLKAVVFFGSVFVGAVAGFAIAWTLFLLTDSKEAALTSVTVSFLSAVFAGRRYGDRLAAERRAKWVEGLARQLGVEPAAVAHLLDPNI